jgi:hypothetical protein
MSSLSPTVDVNDPKRQVRFLPQTDIPVFSPEVAQGCKLAVMT